MSTSTDPLVIINLFAVAKKGLKNRRQVNTTGGDRHRMHIWKLHDVIRKLKHFGPASAVSTDYAVIKL